MKEDLAACGVAIKDFLFTSGLRNCRLMDPTRQLLSIEASDIWGVDPIRPKKEVGLLADSVIKVEHACSSTQVKAWASSGNNGLSGSLPLRRDWENPRGNSRYNNGGGGSQRRGGSWTVDTWL